MYAIMGITGRVGSAIAENLLAQGEQIRAIVRNPEKAARWRDRGAEIAVADVDDPNALASAFEGADGVFLMVPPDFAPAPGFPELRKTLASYRAALAKALPRKAVIPFVDWSRADQRVGPYHRFASPGANTRRTAHCPRVPEGWLVHGKSCLGRYHRTVRGKDLL
jgi:uncharacterized protein YbjT (DUF2867 family)